MATIAPGSSAYLVMTTMATLINQAQDDYQIQVDATGAATRHMIEVAEGELDMAMTSPIIYHFMRQGTGMYQELPEAPELAENLRLMFWFPYGQYHYVVYADSGIETLGGHPRPLGLPRPAGGRRLVFSTRLGRGTDRDDGRRGLRERTWQLVLGTAGLPGSPVRRLRQRRHRPLPAGRAAGLTARLRLLGLTEDEFAESETAQALTTRLGAELGIIPAGTYGEGVVNTEDVYTHGASVGVTVRADLDEETVYQLTRTFWEQADAASRRPALAAPSRASTTPCVKAACRLHPGALRYYEEIGLDIPEGSR
jgi:uncharacterized protein